MRPILIDIQSTFKDSVYVKNIHLPYLDTPFHFHNAYEMVLVVKSSGRRIIGDSIENFEDGDLVLMGPGLPHVWYNDKDYYIEGSDKKVKAIVTYFHPDWLNENILKSSELSKLRALFEHIQRGIKITGKIKTRVIKHIIKLDKSNGLKRIIIILNILELLSTSEEYECLTSPGYVNSYNHKDMERMDKVYQYVMNNYTKKILLKEVANIASMTPTAFCKYFKTRTQKTFTKFVNEVRIAYACKLLCEENLNIGDIYYQCGFNNFTNFNRNFKALKNMNPTEFRMGLNLKNS